MGMRARRMARRVAAEIMERARRQAVDHAGAVLRGDTQTFMSPDAAEAWAKAILKFYDADDELVELDHIPIS